MKVYVAYEQVAVVMLLITIFIYQYKNWLDLRKNRIYARLLLGGVMIMLVDIILEICSFRSVGDREILQKALGIWTNIAFPVLYFHILLYQLAITKKLRIFHTALFRGFIFIGVAVTLITIFMIIQDISFLLPAQQKWAGGAGYHILMMLFLAACLLCALYFVVISRRELLRREFLVLSVTDVILLAGVFLWMFFGNRMLSSYYIISMILILFYLALHNSDQYRFLPSRCFGRAGFGIVLKEKAYYRENFACLGICINNIESITNYCTEKEIVQLHRRFGRLLRYYCGRKNTYNIHSFEYMAVLKGADGVEKLHQTLAEGIPNYIRINGKNVPILCNVYAVEFADAGYDEKDFKRILSSMRKMAMSGLDRRNLLRYQGEKQMEIQNDLEAMRIVNACIAKREFQYQVEPIRSLSDSDTLSYEFIICQTLENGSAVSQERIWELAHETECSKEVGYITCEMLCAYIREKNILEGSEAAERMHLNLSPCQVLNPAAAEKYVQILSDNGISGEKVCFEITIDQDVDYEMLTESFGVLKKYGIYLLLDQFGVCVCSLKNVLNMPFDAVKLNNYMVQAYCTGESHQLDYLVNMLRTKGWEIYLDGVDRLEQIEILCKLRCSYIQGMALQLSRLSEKIEEYFVCQGGDTVD